MVMTFGRYAGMKLTQLPVSYLRWLLTCLKITVELRREVERLLDPSSNDRLTSSDVIARWYRKLASEFHPDASGNHEGMKAINCAHDLLREMVKHEG